jgi:hypothetical protein
MSLNGDKFERWVKPQILWTESKRKFKVPFADCPVSGGFSPSTKSAQEKVSPKMNFFSRIEWNLFRRLKFEDLVAKVFSKDTFFS